MDKQTLVLDRITHFFSSATVVLLQLGKGEVRGAGGNLQPHRYLPLIPTDWTFKAQN